MNKKGNICRIAMAHAIGIVVGISAGMLVYFFTKPVCKAEMMKKKMKKAFKNIESKMEI